MSSNLILALIVLPVTGALIAWAGDAIGYRLGKSRRSLFGLRPRITARLVGVAFGAALPLAGLGFAMAVSPDARDAVLRIDRLREEARSLSAAAKHLTQDYQRAQKDAETARHRAQEANVSRASAEQNLSATRGQLAASQTRLQALQGNLKSARAGLAAARSALAKAQTELGSARRDVKAARQQYQKARDSLARAHSNLQAAREGIAQTTRELADSRAQLGQTQADLTTAQMRLMSVQAELEPMRNVERQLRQAQLEYEALQLKLSATQQVLERYRTAHRAIVAQDVAYEPGDEIVRAFVESGRTQDQLEAVLSLYLDYASRAAAEKHGIAAGPNGRSVRVVSPVPFELLPGPVTEADIINHVASQIREGDAPKYVAIVRAWGRTFRQQAEQMAVELWVAPNKVVFHAGDTMLSATIDGSQPRAVVFRDVWQLVKDVRRVTADRGMLPNPKTGLYGEVPADEILDTLDELLALKAPARVSVVAVTDAYVAQPENAPILVKLDVKRTGDR
jgi:uncharacterized protein (DUF3084 family)